MVQNEIVSDFFDLWHHYRWANVQKKANSPDKNVEWKSLLLQLAVLDNITSCNGLTEEEDKGTLLVTVTAQRK